MLHNITNKERQRPMATLANIYVYVLSMWVIHTYICTYIHTIHTNIHTKMYVFALIFGMAHKSIFRTLIVVVVVLPFTYLQLFTLCQTNEQTLI